MTGERKDESGRGRGRPRRAEVDRAVLNAAAELLAERGYAELTIEAVAARAGVGRPTVYRRWPTKDDLAVHALAHAVQPLDVPDTGDALGDLCELAISFVIQLSESPLGRVVLGVHAESGRRAQLAEPLRDRYLKPRDAAITDAIERARQQGALHPDLAAETIRDLLFGPLVYHWLITGEPLDRATAESLIAAVRRAISP